LASAMTKQRTIVVMAGMMLAMLLSSLDQTIVGTAMPRIIAQFGGMSQYAWVFTAYMVTSTATLPILGRMSDKFGRKWFYVGGIIAFMVGSALCGASQTMTQLIMFRGFQGIGAGIMMANSMAIIGDIFPPAERGKWQGIMGSVFGISAVIGPTVGGYLTDSLNWRWVFYVNLPVGILAVAVLFFALPHIRPIQAKKPIDFAGVAGLIFTVVPMLIALSWAGTSYPWMSVQVAGLLVFSAIMAVVFIWTESKAQDPVLPLSLFKNSIFSMSAIAMFLTGIGMFGAILYIPLFVQGVIGSTATQSGMVLTPLMLSLVVASIISGQLISRWGRYRILALIGTGIMTAGMFLLAGMAFGTTNADAIRNMIILGAGLGITMPLFTIAVQNAVHYRDLGVATSAAQFFRSIGGTVGTAIMGSILVNRLAVELPNHLPQAVKQAIPADKLAQFNNPEILLDPASLAHIKAQFPAAMSGAFDQLMQALRVSLAMSLQEVFMIGAVLVGISLVAVFFLKEIPLRKTHHEHAGAKSFQEQPVAINIEGSGA
jgi:EmrB/QacA subfamily drug resistance transporter